MAAQNGQQPSRLLVTGTVLFYLVAALAMVMANKWVLNTTDAPLFFLWAQVVIAVILFLVCHALNLVKVPLEVNMELIRGLTPMVGLSVIGLSFSNYTLKYVDASFYQVARGMVLPFTVLTSFYWLNARPSSNILLACLFVTAGFFVGVFLDGTPISSVGIFFGVTSSMITAIHSVVIKKSLDVVKGSALHLSWYTNLFSAVVLLPIIFVAGEGPAIMRLLFDYAGGKDGGMSPFATFVWGSAITGLFGFLMSIASLLSIKVTSPITHMVSSAVRGVAASLLGMWLFHDIITSGRAGSIGIILAGSVYYTWVKHQESQTSRPANTTKSGYDRVPLDELEKGAAAKVEGKPE